MADFDQIPCFRNTDQLLKTWRLENIDIVGSKIKLKSLEGCILNVKIKYPQKDSVREFGGMDRHIDSGLFEPIRRMANGSFIEDWCKQAFSGPPKDHDSL